MLLSVANSVGLVGITAYFYKQLEAQRLDLIKISQTLTAVTRKVAEMEKGEQNKGEALHALNNQIKEVTQRIENMPTFDPVDNLDVDLDEIIYALEENNIRVDRPSQVVRPRRGGDRRGTGRRQEEDDRPSSYGRRATARSSERSSTRDEGRFSGRDESRFSGRDESRVAPRGRDTMPPARDFAPGQDYRHRQEQWSETSNYEEDNDIINQVRQQQTR